MGDQSSPFDGLPSHIIPSIISLLPIDEAARTSTLSHTWSDLWTWVTHLNLNRGEARRKTTEIFSFKDEIISREIETCCALTREEVDHILWSQRANISSFRILLCVKHHSPYDVQRWVEFSNRKGVQTLALVNCTSHGISHEKVLSVIHIRSENLRELELSGYQLGSVSCFPEAKNLTTLKLQNVELEPKALERIISNCSSLEILFLRKCSVTRIKICYPPNLKLLEMTKVFSVASVEIRAKNLQILVLDMVRAIVKIDAPDLSILSLGRVFFENTPLQRYEVPFSSHCDAEFLGHYFCLHGESPVERPMYEFDKLQGLFINLDLDDLLQNILLAFILRRCTHLRELDIMLVREPSIYQSPGREDWTNYWEKRVSADCVVQRLKKTRLTGFTGQHLQLGFAKFLITNASALSELQIRFRKNSSKKLVEATSAKLLSAPKASFDLRLNIQEEGP